MAVAKVGVSWARLDSWPVQPARGHGPLCGHAHTLRMWRNAATHECGRWADPPNDFAVEEVIEGVMSELARLGW